MARTVQNRVYLECGSECGADPMATGSPFRRRRKRRRKRMCLWETPLEKARWGPTAAFLVSPSGMVKDLHGRGQKIQLRGESGDMAAF